MDRLGAIMPRAGATVEGAVEVARRGYDERTPLPIWSVQGALALLLYAAAIGGSSGDQHDHHPSAVFASALMLQRVVSAIRPNVMREHVRTERIVTMMV